MNAPVPVVQSTRPPGTRHPGGVEHLEIEQSQTLAALSYEPETAVLDVEFRNGAIYRYFAVPRRLLRDVAEADSPGSVYNRRLRGSTASRRSEAACGEC